MTNAESLLQNIVELINLYSRQLDELQLKSNSLEDDLGETRHPEDAERLRAILDRTELNRQSVEKLIFDLNIKRIELQFLGHDYKDKNFLAIFSIGVSTVLTAIIIILTFYQVTSNYDLVAVAVDQAEREGASNVATLDKLRSTCSSVQDKNTRIQIDQLASDLKNANLKFDRKLDGLKIEFDARIKSLNQDNH